MSPMFPVRLHKSNEVGLQPAIGHQMGFVAELNSTSQTLLGVYFCTLHDLNSHYNFVDKMAFVVTCRATPMAADPISWAIIGGIAARAAAQSAGSVVGKVVTGKLSHCCLFAREVSRIP